MAIILSVKQHWTLLLAFGCFAAQGMANSLLGVAWPSIRDTFGLPIDTLVVLLTGMTIGYVSGSVMAGRVMAATGISRFLLFGNVIAGAGLLGYTIAPSWAALVACGLLVGLVNGAMSASLNIYVAATRTVRIMNWMHATYGIGATVGPLIMTAALTSWIGWRLGYVVAGLVHVSLGLLFFTVLRQMTYRGMPPDPEGGDAARSAGILQTLRLPIVILGVLLFLLYTGVETSTGQWSFSLFTEARDISTGVAGIMTSLFWGMLTLGRIVFGAAAERIGTTRLLRLSIAGTVLASLLFMVRLPAAGLAAVTIMGLSLAAIFPTFLSDTANRVEYRYVSNAVGLQSAAASIGLATLPGLVGILAARFSLEVLGPFLLVATLLMLVINEWSNYLARRRRQAINMMTAKAPLD